MDENMRGALKKEDWGGARKEAKLITGKVSREYCGGRWAYSPRIRSFLHSGMV